ncbi:casein kinase II, regulatory subunit [Trametes punicea]|nr:casein kinase II, regulatory subunit [Trametes punicea]
MLDRTNLTGLNTEVQHYGQALDMITDNLDASGFLDEEIRDDLRGNLDLQARLLHELIHARWMVTARELATMLEKYKRAESDRCPRVLCQSRPLLSVCLTYQKSVKLYCGRCEDIYSPKSSQHGSLDGAYFGTSFLHLLFLVYPNLIPPKSGPAEFGFNPRVGDIEGGCRSRRIRKEQETQAEGPAEAGSTAAVALKPDRYRPRIFGFQVNEIMKLQRWQEAVRDKASCEVSRTESQRGHVRKRVETA